MIGLPAARVVVEGRSTGPGPSSSLAREAGTSAVKMTEKKKIIATKRNVQVSSKSSSLPA